MVRGRNPSRRRGGGTVRRHSATDRLRFFSVSIEVVCATEKTSATLPEPSTALAAVSFIAALALAMIIDSFVVKHISGVRLGYFLPYAIPGVVASIIWVYLYNGQISPLVKGLAALGINVDFFADNIVLASMENITTWTFTGYNMLIFLAALQAIPHDLYEAARIDGANGWQIAMKIKLPNVRSAALLAMLLSIVGTIQLFNEPQIMQTADPGISKSFTPMMMAMNTSQGTLTPSGDGPASAVAIMMALIAGVLAMAYALVERKVNEE